MTMRLVQQKQGFVGRKILHVFVNLSFAIYAFLVPVDWILPTAVLGFIFVLVFDFIRLNTKAKKIVHDAVGPLFKKKESFQASGLFWAGVAAMMGALYASQEVLAYAFLVLALADPAAGLLGKYSKSRKLYRSKTLNGVLIFFLISTCASLAFALFVFDLQYPLYWALFMGAALALTEMFSHPYDDNFTIILIATAFTHASFFLL